MARQPRRKKTLEFNGQKITKEFAQAFKIAKQQTAADVRSKARRLITLKPAPNAEKLTKKQEKLLGGEHSAAGEPPYSTTGRIAQIEYVQEGEDWIVGPRQFKYSGTSHGRFTWGVLEHGGHVGESTLFKAKPRNRRKLRSRGELPPLAAPARQRKKRSSPAKQAQRQTLRSRKERPKGYRYFFSEEARERAQKSDRFLTFFKNAAPEKVIIPPCDIAARPFMSKALAAEAKEKRMLTRIKKASKNILR